MFRLIFAALALFFLTGCEQQNTKSPQVVAFTATWCEPCQRDKPALNDLERHGIKVVRIDADTHPELIRKYRVTSLPTYIVYDNGKEVKRTQDIRLVWKVVKWLIKRHLLN